MEPTQVAVNELLKIVLNLTLRQMATDRLLRKLNVSQQDIEDAVRWAEENNPLLTSPPAATSPDCQGLSQRLKVLL
jgi:hypothetical protein